MEQSAKSYDFKKALEKIWVLHKNKIKIKTP